MKRVEQCYFEALKTGFVENKGQSGRLSADSKTKGNCQLSVKFSAICQLSVNPIQTLVKGPEISFYFFSLPYSSLASTGSY